MRYLLDSNIVINYLNGSIPAAGMEMINVIVDIDPLISVITKMETLGFSFQSADEQNLTETFINGSMVLGIDDKVVSKTIDIRRTEIIKLPDAIIAATAIVNDLTLLTRNTKDFTKIGGLQIIDRSDYEPFRLKK